MEHPDVWPYLSISLLLMSIAVKVKTFLSFVGYTLVTVVGDYAALNCVTLNSNFAHFLPGNCHPCSAEEIKCHTVTKLRGICVESISRSWL